MKKNFILIIIAFVLCFSVSAFSQTCQWAEKIGGNAEDRANSITTDANGDVYIAGYYLSPTVTFNNGITLSNDTYSDGFIAKYNSNGICQWAEKISGMDAEGTNSISIDASGNVYVAGHFGSGILTFNNNITLLNSGDYDGFIAKYVSTGVCQWAEKIAGTDEDRAYSVNTDAYGNVFVAGFFSSAILSLNNGITLSSSGLSDGYIAKYNSSGVCQWAEKIAGTEYDYAKSINTDAYGNVFVTGDFLSSTLTFNNGITVSNSGLSDGYIAKYNSDGVCQWAEKIAGTSNDYSSSIITDANGNVYVAGDFWSAILTFNNSIAISSSGYRGGFITKYNSDGVCQWAEKIAGTWWDIASSIIIDANGNLYAAGNFQSPILTFNNDKTLSNSGNWDVYIAKYAQNQISLDTPALLTPQNNSDNIPINPVLEWSSVENASSYTLQIATDADFENIIVDDTEIIDTSNQVNDLIIYTTYFWRVKAANNLVESPWSEVWNFTTIWGANEAEAIFAVGPNLNTARVGHKAIGLPDGRFILFGGHGNGFIPLNTAEIWTPSNPNIFSSIVMNNTRDYSALVKLNDGRYLLAGSAYSSGVPAYSHSEIYNPENNTFTTVGNMTRTRMTSSGIALSNDNVLIAGAWYQSNSAIYGDLFDISNQTYSSVGPLSSGRSYPIVMPTNDGNAMVFGGSGVNGGALENPTVEEYNAITSTFTTIRNSLFEDETGWHASSGGNRSNFEQLMPDGRYLWLAGKTVNNVTYRRLFTFNPETKEIEEFITNPPLPVHSVLAVSTQPVIDRIRNTAHFIVRTSTNSNEPPTIKVLSLNLETAELVLSSNSYEFNYYEPFQTIVVLADGRLFLTGGSANNTNFSLVNNTLFITPPLFENNEQQISLNLGWNTISSNIIPNQSNLEDIFAEMEELVIVKNADGQIYNPAQNINQIGDWNIAHGYMVYVTAPATLQITGTAVNPTETEINLVSGWNLVSYLRNSPLAISTALAGINSSIILVKNNIGQLYYPAYGLNTIGNMQPGQGYWIYMNSPAVLVYPGN